MRTEAEIRGKREEIIQKLKDADSDYLQSAWNALSWALDDSNAGAEPALSDEVPTQRITLRELLAGPTVRNQDEWINHAVRTLKECQSVLSNIPLIHMERLPGGCLAIFGDVMTGPDADALVTLLDKLGISVPDRWMRGASE